MESKTTTMMMRELLLTPIGELLCGLLVYQFEVKVVRHWIVDFVVDGDVHDKDV